MNIPDNLRYTKDHEWIRIEGETVTVGITDHAQGELGDIVYVEFPEIGDEVSKDEPFGTIEAVKTVADLFAPISGEIIEVNSAIDDTPEAVNLDSYGKGWLVKILLSDSSEVGNLLTADDYKEYLANQ